MHQRLCLNSLLLSVSHLCLHFAERLSPQGHGREDGYWQPKCHVLLTWSFSFFLLRCQAQERSLFEPAWVIALPWIPGCVQGNGAMVGQVCVMGPPLSSGVRLHLQIVEEGIRITFPGAHDYAISGPDTSWME